MCFSTRKGVLAKNWLAVFARHTSGPFLSGLPGPCAQKYESKRGPCRDVRQKHHGKPIVNSPLVRHYFLGGGFGGSP